MFEHLQVMGGSGAELLRMAGLRLAPLLPLLAWAAYWLLLVDWPRLRIVLLRGGWIGLIGLILLFIATWHALDPEPRREVLLGLRVSALTNKVATTSVYVVVMLLCGAFRLSRAQRLPDPEEL